MEESPWKRVEGRRTKGGEERQVDSDRGGGGGLAGEEGEDGVEGDGGNRMEGWLARRP